MQKEDLLYLIPTKRVKAFDGMAVTSEVWELAHEYTRQQLRFHRLLNHRPGILVGLNVIASIPPDTSVYILPGVAIDNWGQTIIVQQPLTFKIGTSIEGLIYLVLQYGESPPRAEKGRGQEGAPQFVHDEFKVSAESKLPDTPFVEIARIHRETRTTTIHNAAIPENPGFNEIDLRFRSVINPPIPPLLRVSAHYVGGMNQAQHGRGIHNLTEVVNRQGRYRVIVDVNSSLDSSNLEQYDLIYMVGQQQFELSRAELNNLYNFLKNGGTVLFESCQRARYSADSAASGAFKDMIDSFGFSLNPIQADERLLQQPHLFAQAPRGFEPQGGLQIGDGIILSSYDYGGAWQAQRRDTPPNREEIRSSFEWGENILHYAWTRREQAKNPDQRTATSLSSQLMQIITQPE